jgi:hypothetical protein
VVSQDHALVRDARLHPIFLDDCACDARVCAACRGKAGHCLLAGIVFMFCYKRMAMADAATLYIDDGYISSSSGEEDDEGDEGEAKETSAP